MAAAPQSFNSVIVHPGSPVIPAPTGVAVGNFLLVQIYARDDTGTDVNITPPSGWTLIRLDSIGTNFYERTFSYYKFADSADAVATSFTFTASNPSSTYAGGFISRWTKVDSTTPINAHNGGTSVSSSSTITCSGVTPTKATTIVLMPTSENIAARTFSGYSLTTSSPTFTELYDTGGNASPAGNITASLAYGLRTATTSTGTASVTLSGSSPILALQIIALNGEVIHPEFFGAATGWFTVSVPTRISSLVGAATGVLQPTVTFLAKTWTNAVKHAASWRTPFTKP